MRALLKHILKASGTPVLETREGGEETILSAGNIWTSAHARRIELRERGLVPGAVLCSAAGGFQAVIDFVACAIGGFVYLPVSPARQRALKRELASSPAPSAAGIAFIDTAARWEQHFGCLPSSLAGPERLGGAQLILCGERSGLQIFTASAIEACLDRLSADWQVSEGGTRLSYCPAHHDLRLVTDLLLGIRNRQTIHLRDGSQMVAAEMLDEILDLGVDELVLAPTMLSDLLRESRLLTAASRVALGRIRYHAPGRMLSSRQSSEALRLFDRICVAG